MIETASETHEISVFDIVSLYPFINYSAGYPTGIPRLVRPEVTHVDWADPADVIYRGLLKVRAIPPRGLKMPVLPCRIPGDDRLLFTLCIPCATHFKKQCPKFDNDDDDDEQYMCPHSDDQRAFTSTIYYKELKEALRCGYRVTHLYRAWSWDEEQFDKNIFKDYIRLFMTLKIESSGFPAQISSEVHKQNWAAKYQDRYGIDINLGNVAYNPGKINYKTASTITILFNTLGLRHISKIALNSLWYSIY